MIYTACILTGIVSGGTFSGFIVETAPWPVQFWYNVGLEALVATLCVLFLDETGWTRPGGEQFPLPPEGFMKRKLATYAFTQRLMPYKTSGEILKLALRPWLLAVYPVTIMVGLPLSIYFAWCVSSTTTIGIYLQSPLDEGGYAFTPYQNAWCKYLNPA
jgi:hypothetical protein